MNITNQMFLLTRFFFLILLFLSLSMVHVMAHAEKCPVICKQKFMKEMALTSTNKKSASEIISVLEKATKETDIHIYLRDGGGKLREGERIINAMQASKGRTIVEVIGSAKSMGALIMLNADVVLTKSNTLIMFHMPRSREMVCSLSNKIKDFQNCAKYFLLKYGRYIHAVLSKQQWKRFLAGKDVYVSGGDLVDRLPKAKLLPRRRWFRRYS